MLEIRIGLGQWLGSWFSRIAPMTPALQEFTTRPLKDAITLVPARMVDAAQDMVNLWYRNQPEDGKTVPAKLPVVLVAMAADPTPTGRDRGRPVSDPVFVNIPEDGKARMFELITMTRDYRVQLVFAANDPDSAASLAGQFCNWVDHPSRQAFEATWGFSGLQMNWPVQMQTADIAALSIKTDVKNLTLLALDFTLCATEPIYRAPGAGEAYVSTDGTTVGVHGPDAGTGLQGNGPGATKTDLPGFPLVREILAEHAESSNTGGTSPVSAHVVDASGVQSVEQLPYE